jgi:hypothetical protein
VAEDAGVTHGQFDQPDGEQETADAGLGPAGGRALMTTEDEADAAPVGQRDEECGCVMAGYVPVGGDLG